MREQQHDDERREQHLDGLEQRDDVTAVATIRERAAHEGEQEYRRAIANESAVLPRDRKPTQRQRYCANDVALTFNSGEADDAG